MSIGIGMTVMLPRVVGAADVTETEVEIRTPDGVADAYFVHPSSGAHPGVLIWADALGLRPAFQQMAKRLAESGYSVLVPKMKAQYLIAIAANDDERQPDAKNVLRDAFAAAKLPAEIEVYAGAMHGWCPPDATVYNEAQTEKAWSRMLALFKTALA